MKSPLKDWKHWIGHIIVTMAIFVVMFIVLWLNIPSPYSFMLLFVVLVITIALVDTMNHKLMLQ